MHREWVGGGKVIVTWGEDGIIAWTDHKHLLPLLCQQKVSDNFYKAISRLYLWLGAQQSYKDIIKATKNYHFFSKRMPLWCERLLLRWR